MGWAGTWTLPYNSEVETHIEKRITQSCRIIEIRESLEKIDIM